MPASAPVRHLLIRAPNWLGDLVMATPVLAAAGAAGFERVTVVVREGLAALLEDEPLPGELVSVRGRDEWRRWRATGADGALLLSTSFGAAWRATRAGIPVRIGAALGLRRWLLTEGVVPPSRAGRRLPVPTAGLMVELARRAGIAIDDLEPRLTLGPRALEQAAASLSAAGLEPGRPYALCAPGAAFGAAKLWPPEHFAAALDQLHERSGLIGVVTGGPGEEAQMEAVRGACRHPAVGLADQPRGLVALKGLVAGAAVLLVGDSGPRWVAAAFGTPCVTVMGPNFPELTASSLDWCTVVRVEGLECSPCLRRSCPLGHHRCMRELDPAAVVDAAEALLERKRARATETQDRQGG